jgi:shikimate 5-dehydrogenase
MSGAKLLIQHQVPVDSSFAVLGSGGMAKAVVAALRDAGFWAGEVVARNARTGTALADQYGYSWRAELGSGRPRLVVNATPVGMSGGPAADDLPVEPELTVSPTLGGVAGDTAAPPRRISMTEESSCRPSPARRPAR